MGKNKTKFKGRCYLSVWIEINEETEEKFEKELDYFQSRVEEKLKDIRGVKVQFESDQREEVEAELEADED